MQPPLPFNTRYILEQERDGLLEEQRLFDDKYATFTFALLAGVETLALLAYLCVAVILAVRPRLRSKTNLVVVIWAVMNFAVLLQKLSTAYGISSSETSVHVGDMLAASGRSYGTAAGVAWLLSKYSGKPKAKYDPFLYFLVSLPALICCSFIYYSFAVNPYIYEVFGPGSDVVHVLVYFIVGVAYLACNISASRWYEVSPYALVTSLANLFTNFPVCLVTIYLRFNLDIGWVYRFHMNFVDVAINLLSCSSAFVVLLVLVIYTDDLKTIFSKKKQYISVENHATIA